MFPYSWPFSSGQFSCSVVSDSLRPHGLQHARLPCPSSTPVAYSNSYNPLNVAHPSWNVSESQQSAAEAARKGRGHVGSWTSVASGSEGNPRWERGHREGGWHVGWAWPSDLKMPTCLQLEQITQPKLPFTRIEQTSLFQTLFIFFNINLFILIGG